ncbi:hypothetical protein C4572_01020 [Candidatus Parcubacteria bacterium]|nr:MAG: hypothetical protein C4572_01020 [Candidatus Parcubacteria bacterium]
MKNLIINIADSNIAKNILRTGVLNELKKSKLRLVLLVPASKKSNYHEEFSDENVIVDAWPDVLPSKIERLCLFAAKNSIPTHAVRQIQEVGFDGRTMRMIPYVLARLFWVVGHLPFWRSILAFIASRFFQDRLFQEIFDRYKPDMVFTHTIYSTNDLRLLKGAKRSGVSSIGMIKSWDNLTSKDPLLIKPDWLIVHNEIIKKEAIKFGNYPEEKIFISGIPQFDFYADKNFLKPREEFFSELGLDPQRKLVTFFAVGSCLMIHEKEMIELIAEIINSGELNRPCQLLVRLHPAFTSDEEKLKSLQNVRIDRPGKIVSSTKVALRDGWEFDFEETKRLANTLNWSDVSMNCGSTTLVEAAIYDTPVIMTGFDAIKEKNYWRSAERLPKREHMLPVLCSGGTRLVKNKSEMVKWLNNYLGNKNLDKEGRQRLVNEQCYKQDGRSGERICSFILSKIKL